MNCLAANRLYVRSTGTVPCNCDIGEHTTLFSPDCDNPDSFDYARDCYNGEPFRALRKSFSEGRDFLDTCKKCYFYSPSDEFEHAGEDGRLQFIENLQIESSFLCTIDCEACIPRAIRRDPELSPLGEGPYHIPEHVFEKLVTDLSRAKIGIGEFNFCGRGEPLMHPDFSRLIRYAREFYPDSLYAAISNANVRFFPGILDLDYLSVSIDGAFPDSYSLYRRGGNLKRALKLVKDVVDHRRPDDVVRGASVPELVEHVRTKGRPIVRWKYILFDHNDSEKELVQAQETAMELGVDQMVFSLSHTWNRSKVYTTEEEIETLPIFQIFEGKRVIHTNVNPDAKNVEHWEEEHRRRTGAQS